MVGTGWMWGGAIVAAAVLSPSAHAEPVTRAQVDAAIPKLAAMAEKLVTDGAVPGLSVAVVQGADVVYLGGFGVREAGKPGTVDADTVFQIASMSKPVSVTVIASLVTEGIVDWNTRIAELNPRFRLHDPYPTAEVTLRDLLNHRSGLPGTSGDDLEAIGYDRETIGDRLRLVPPSSSFRAGYAYSNAGFTQAGLAAAMPTGKSWEEVADERLYKPLGMTSTSSRHADFIAHEDRARLHIQVDGKWVAAVERQPDAQAPAGGVSSTARDLAEWLRVEMAGEYTGNPPISKAALAATHAPLFARGPNPVTGTPSFYGLGWNVEYAPHGLNWSHAGAFSMGARTLVSIYPDAGVGIIVLCNAFPTGAPEGLAASFFDLVFDGTVSRDWFDAWNAIFSGLFGPTIAAVEASYRTPPSPGTPALPDTAYAGRYANAYVGTATVTAGVDGLVLTLGPDSNVRFPLRHFDRDLFLYEASPDLPGFPTTAQFVVGADQRATAVTLQSLDDNGMGTLTRVP